jgi:hypothetical protein
MKITLLIAAPFVGGHADYLVKLGTPIFGILLVQADRTPHTAQTPDNTHRVIDMEDIYI